METEVLGHRDDDGAVHQRGEQWTRSDEQDPDRRNPETRDDDRQDERREARVQQEEPPRLVVEIAEGCAKCGLRAHPLTPAVVTPAMK